MKPEEFTAFVKEKGFIYPSSDIYGGLAGFYDYGHNGTKLKHKFENAWRKFFLGLNDNFHEIETANIMHKNVFKASGHLENFTDPIIRCTKCEFFARADHFLEEHTGERNEDLDLPEFDAIIKEKKLSCPNCKSEFKPAEHLNLMFPVNDNAYLRPETAQSPFVNFKLQFQLLREKMPMGLGLVGRAYRNEISPRNLTIRQREFTQAELQIFFNPSKIDEHEDFDSIKHVELSIMRENDRKDGIKIRTAEALMEEGLPKFYVYHLAKIQEFYMDVLNLPKDKFRLYELVGKEKAFYNKYHFDLEANLDGHGWTEIGGLHYRTDHDLHGHQDISKQKMQVTVDGEKFIPHVLEISMGVDRNVYALIDAHTRDDERGNKVLSLPVKLAPTELALFPLVNKVNEKAREIYNAIKDDFDIKYDKSGSVGRRYARSDEEGTPFCITVDFEDGVTIRSRDTTEQVRLNGNLHESLRKILAGAALNDVGSKIEPNNNA